MTDTYLMTTSTQKKKDKTALILNIIKLISLILSFLLLVIPYIPAQEKTTLYVVSGGPRQGTIVDHNDLIMNFFGRMSYLSSKGFAPIWEIVFLAVLAINIVVAAVAMIPRFKILNEIYFSVLPLAAMVLCIVVCVEGDVIYTLDSEFLWSTMTERAYVEETVRFYGDPIFTLFGCALAFGSGLASGLRSRLKNKSAKIQNDSIAVSPAPQIADKRPQVTAFIESIPDELKKYKELLDAGIISQEEFDTKKKELLGI